MSPGPILLVEPLDVLTEGSWNFDRPGPRWAPAPYAAGADFDPFPAYPHDQSVAWLAASHAALVVPPLWPVTIYLANREATSRTNGHSNAWVGQHWDDEADAWVREQPRGYILLAGKRIMPHPAMTRQLVGHEYGHQIEWMLNQARGAKTIYDSDLIHEYAKLRGLDSCHHGAGGTWHNSPTEVFACDFRILVLGVETESWPHPGVIRPEVAAGLHAWWGAAVADLAAARDNPDVTGSDQ